MAPVAGVARFMSRFLVLTPVQKNIPKESTLRGWGVGGFQKGRFLCGESLKTGLVNSSLDCLCALLLRRSVLETPHNQPE